MHRALGRFTGMHARRDAVRPVDAAVVAKRLHARYEARLKRWDRHLAQVHAARERAAAKAAALRAHAATTRRAKAQAATTLDGYTVVGHLTVMATAYWPDPSWSNGYTATGVRAGYGVVAVDPNVIPLGTHLYIPGYGQAVAADTGSAIIGDHIDLCYPTGWQAQDWGVQYVTITIER